MKKEILKGKWNQFKGKIREKWGRLTHNELVQIQGRTEQLVGKLQTKEMHIDMEAIKELEDFERSLAQERADKSAGKKIHKAHFPQDNQDVINEEESSDDIDKRTGAR